MQPLSIQLAALFGHYNLIFLAYATLTTLALAVAGCVIGSVCGLVLALIRFIKRPWLVPLQWVIILYTELMRRIPFLVTLFMTLYIIQGFGYTLSFFVIGLIAVCLISSAYLAEIFRAGFQSIVPAQIEAALTLNFTQAQILTLVVIPQSLKVILPSAFSFMVSLIKDTALASQLGVIELAFAGKLLISRGMSSFLIYGVILVLYFLMSYPLSCLGRYLERRLFSESTNLASHEASADFHNGETAANVTVL